MIMPDNLAIYRGQDFRVNQYITLHHPTLGEICDFGEETFWTTCKNLVSTPADMKVAIYDNLHIWWDELTCFDLFLYTYKSFTKEQTSIILGDLDLSEFLIYQDNDTKKVVLRDPNSGLVIDEVTYEVITGFIRKICGFKKNMEVGADNNTKFAMIEADRDDLYFEKQKSHGFTSLLLPMVSSMINSSGFKYNYKEVWDMPIFAFMDSVKRIQSIDQYKNYMRGIYSGCIDGSKISNKSLDWMRDLS